MAKKLPKAIKFDEFKLLMKNTMKYNSEDKVSKVAFLLAYETGMRLSEVLALRPDHIQETHIQVWSGKGDKDRVVPKPKGWRDWMLKELPIKLSGRSLERNFNKACAKANLPSFYTFHSLRHGFATRMIENGVPLSHIQVLLGHSNISTTNVYTKARPMDALKSYEEMW